MKRASDFKVGDSFTLIKDVDQYRPIMYAGAGNDFNPLHIDPEFGKLIGMGGVILHGMCTYAFMTEAVTKFVEDPGALKSISARFKKPVKPGEKLTFIATVTDITEGRINFEITGTNKKDQPIITSAVATVELPV